MAKILVADDESDLEILIKQRFRRQIRENKYQFQFALNGRQALELLQQNSDIDVVLSDINMPEMDGLTLLSNLSETSPLVKTVIVSAYGDMDNIRSAMNKGAFDFVCKPVNFEDLEITIEKTLEHVKQLKETLQAIKENNILKMYVDESVLNFMNKQEFEASLMSNEAIEASVVFIDICSFTSITETAPADKVVGLLNKYFDVMVKEIIAQGGFVDKFIGDAVMAVFRGDYHLDRAIEAALAVRAQVGKLPAEQNGVDFSPSVSVGIHTGEMVCGNIGSVTLRRLDYTVIGDVVNTAQRLQAAAHANQILLTQENYKKVNEFFTCEKIGEISVKNKRDALVVYNVVS
jgi:class 3 adenylate cyclase/FixJ family two-component response regulator